MTFTKAACGMRYAVCVFAFLAVAPASADEALAKAKGCTACHDTKKKLLGPAKWGQIPMPPNKVAEEEAKKLSGWILAL